MPSILSTRKAHWDEQRRAIIARCEAWDAGTLKPSAANVSVIVPTVFRPTLLAALESFHRQQQPDDEILVVGPASADVPTWCRHIVRPSGGRWGNEERRAGIKAALGDYLAFMDDDDQFLDGARAAMTKAATIAPGLPVIFRMHGPMGLIWAGDPPPFKNANLSSQMLFVPNQPTMLGRWGDRLCGDFEFMNNSGWQKFAPRWSYDGMWVRGELVFRPEVIATYRPGWVSTADGWVKTEATATR